MNKQVDTLLLSLDDEIEKKCFEIRQKRKEKALHRFFIQACVLFVLLPFLLVLLGVNFLALLVSAIVFPAVSLIILILLLLNDNREGFVQ